MAPDGPTHTPAAPPCPHPTPFAPNTRKSVTLPRHPLPAPPHPSPRTSYPSPRLRHFFPPVRPNPAISPPSIAIYVHPCYHLSREGPTPQLGNPSLKRVGLQASVGASLVGAQATAKARPVDPAPSHCPLLPRGATFVLRIAQAGITELRNTGDTLNYETHRMSQKLTDFAFPHSLGQRRWGRLGIWNRLPRAGARSVRQGGR